ncbi:heat repeat-containing protein, partial [Cystoisospora suis]
MTRLSSSSSPAVVVAGEMVEEDTGVRKKDLHEVRRIREGLTIHQEEKSHVTRHAMNTLNCTDNNTQPSLEPKPFSSSSSSSSSSSMSTSLPLPETSSLDRTPLASSSYLSSFSSPVSLQDALVNEEEEGEKQQRPSEASPLDRSLGSLLVSLRNLSSPDFFIEMIETHEPFEVLTETCTLVACLLALGQQHPPYPAPNDGSTPSSSPSSSPSSLSFFSSSSSLVPIVKEVFGALLPFYRENDSSQRPQKVSDAGVKNVKEVMNEEDLLDRERLEENHLSGEIEDERWRLFSRISMRGRLGLLRSLLLLIRREREISSQRKENLPSSNDVPSGGVALKERKGVGKKQKSASEGPVLFSGSGVYTPELNILFVHLIHCLTITQDIRCKREALLLLQQLVEMSTPAWLVASLEEETVPPHETDSHHHRDDKNTHPAIDTDEQTSISDQTTNSTRTLPSPPSPSTPSYPSIATSSCLRPSSLPLSSTSCSLSFLAKDSGASFSSSPSLFSQSNRFTLDRNRSTPPLDLLIDASLRYWAHPQRCVSQVARSLWESLVSIGCPSSYSRLSLTKGVSSSLGENEESHEGISHGKGKLSKKRNEDAGINAPPHCLDVKREKKKTKSEAEENQEKEEKNRTDNRLIGERMISATSLPSSPSIELSYRLAVAVFSLPPLYKKAKNLALLSLLPVIGVRWLLQSKPRLLHELLSDIGHNSQTRGSALKLLEKIFHLLVSLSPSEADSFLLSRHTRPSGSIGSHDVSTETSSEAKINSDGDPTLVKKKHSQLGDENNEGKSRERTEEKEEERMRRSTPAMDREIISCRTQVQKKNALDKTLMSDREKLSTASPSPGDETMKKKENLSVEKEGPSIAFRSLVFPLLVDALLCPERFLQRIETSPSFLSNCHPSTSSSSHLLLLSQSDPPERVSTSSPSFSPPPLPIDFDAISSSSSSEFSERIATCVLPLLQVVDPRGLSLLLQLLHETSQLMYRDVRRSSSNGHSFIAAEPHIEEEEEDSHERPDGDVRRRCEASGGYTLKPPISQACRRTDAEPQRQDRQKEKQHDEEKEEELGSTMKARSHRNSEKEEDDDREKKKVVVRWLPWTVGEAVLLGVAWKAGLVSWETCLTKGKKTRKSRSISKMGEKNRALSSPSSALSLKTAASPAEFPGSREADEVSCKNPKAIVAGHLLSEKTRAPPELTLKATGGDLQEKHDNLSTPPSSLISHDDPSENPTSESCSSSSVLSTEEEEEEALPAISPKECGLYLSISGVKTNGKPLCLRIPVQRLQHGLLSGDDRIRDSLLKLLISSRLSTAPPTPIELRLLLQVYQHSSNRHPSAAARAAFLDAFKRLLQRARDAYRKVLAGATAADLQRILRRRKRRSVMALPGQNALSLSGCAYEQSPPCGSLPLSERHTEREKNKKVSTFKKETEEKISSSDACDRVEVTTKKPGPFSHVSMERQLCRQQGDKGEKEEEENEQEKEGDEEEASLESFLIFLKELHETALLQCLPSTPPDRQQTGATILIFLYDLWGSHLPKDLRKGSSCANSAIASAVATAAGASPAPKTRGSLQVGRRHREDKNAGSDAALNVRSETFQSHTMNKKRSQQGKASPSSPQYGCAVAEALGFYSSEVKAQLAGMLASPWSRQRESAYTILKLFPHNDDYSYYYSPPCSFSSSSSLSSCNLSVSADLLLSSKSHPSFSSSSSSSLGHQPVSPAITITSLGTSKQAGEESFRNSMKKERDEDANRRLSQNVLSSFPDRDQQESNNYPLHTRDSDDHQDVDFNERSHGGDSSLLLLPSSSSLCLHRLSARIHDAVLLLHSIRECDFSAGSSSLALLFRQVYVEPLKESLLLSDTNDRSREGDLRMAKKKTHKDDLVHSLRSKEDILVNLDQRKERKDDIRKQLDKFQEKRIFLETSTPSHPSVLSGRTRDENPLSHPSFLHSRDRKHNGKPLPTYASYSPRRGVLIAELLRSSLRKETFSSSPRETSLFASSSSSSPAKSSSLTKKESSMIREKDPEDDVSLAIPFPLKGEIRMVSTTRDLYRLMCVLLEAGKERLIALQGYARLSAESSDACVHGLLFTLAKLLEDLPSLETILTHLSSSLVLLPSQPIFSSFHQRCGSSKGQSATSSGDEEDRRLHEGDARKEGLYLQKIQEKVLPRHNDSCERTTERRSLLPTSSRKSEGDERSFSGECILAKEENEIGREMQSNRYQRMTSKEHPVTKKAHEDQEEEEEKVGGGEEEDVLAVMRKVVSGKEWRKLICELFDLLVGICSSMFYVIAEGSDSVMVNPVWAQRKQDPSSSSSFSSSLRNREKQERTFEGEEKGRSSSSQGEIGQGSFSKEEEGEDSISSSSSSLCVTSSPPFRVDCRGHPLLPRRPRNEKEEEIRKEKEDKGENEDCSSSFSHREDDHQEKSQALSLDREMDENECEESLLAVRGWITIKAAAACISSLLEWVPFPTESQDEREGKDTRERTAVSSPLAKDMIDIVTPSQLNAAGRRLLHFLLSCRHPGAMDSLFECLSSLSRRLLSSPSRLLQSLPRSWLDSLLLLLVPPSILTSSKQSLLSSQEKLDKTSLAKTTHEKEKEKDDEKEEEEVKSFSSQTKE